MICLKRILRRNEILSGGLRGIGMPYGPRWRRWRSVGAHVSESICAAQAVPLLASAVCAQYSSFSAVPAPSRDRVSYPFEPLSRGTGSGGTPTSFETVRSSCPTSPGRDAQYRDSLRLDSQSRLYSVSHTDAALRPCKMSSFLPIRRQMDVRCPLLTCSVHI